MVEPVDVDYIDFDEEEREVNKNKETSKIKGGTHGVHSTGFKDFLLTE